MTVIAKPTVVILFKPVPGGFVYRAPNPWLLGRADHYFVTEAQKDDITARSQPPSLMAMFSSLMAMLLLGVGAAMTFNWFRHSYQLVETTSGDIAIILVAVLASMLLAFRMTFRSQMERLRSLLATLPKSDVKITRADLRRAVLDMNSTKQLWYQVGISVFAAAVMLSQVYFQFRHNRSVLSGDPVSILLLVAACLSGGVAILQILFAMQKARQEHCGG
jgi:hypothetical protein